MVGDSVEHGRANPSPQQIPVGFGGTPLRRHDHPLGYGLGQLTWGGGASLRYQGRPLQTTEERGGIPL